MTEPDAPAPPRPETVPEPAPAEVDDAARGMFADAREAVSRRIERSDWLEVIASVILALATIGTAWAAYQSTRWSGVQASSYVEANTARTESVRASNQAFVERQIDVQTFIAWLQAVADKNQTLRDFYEARFRPEFKPAFEAWLSSVPAGQIPDGTPFALPEYVLASDQRAADLTAQAQAKYDQANRANQTSDNFVLTAVLFASVLFFAGVGTKFRQVFVRRGMIGLAGVLFIVAIGVVLSLPQNVGF